MKTKLAIKQIVPKMFETTLLDVVMQKNVDLLASFLQEHPRLDMSIRSNGISCFGMAIGMYQPDLFMMLVQHDPEQAVKVLRQDHQNLDQVLKDYYPWNIAVMKGYSNHKAYIKVLNWCIKNRLPLYVNPDSNNIFCCTLSYATCVASYPNFSMKYFAKLVSLPTIDLVQKLKTHMHLSSEILLELRNPNRSFGEYQKSLKNLRRQKKVIDESLKYEEQVKIAAVKSGKHYNDDFSLIDAKIKKSEYTTIQAYLSSMLAEKIEVCAALMHGYKNKYSCYHENSEYAAYLAKIPNEIKNILGSLTKDEQLVIESIKLGKSIDEISEIIYINETDYLSMRNCLEILYPDQMMQSTQVSIARLKK